MTYSCTDFTDDITNRLIEVGAITAEESQDPEASDNPGLQAGYALNAIKRLAEAKDSLQFLMVTLSEFAKTTGTSLQYGPLCEASERAAKALRKFQVLPSQKG